jgi:hypothetical protein
MAPIALALLVAFLLGLAVALYALLAPRRSARPQPEGKPAPLQTDTGWTRAAGEEFAGLSEAARCDMIFAVAALDDERSMQLLEHALGDPAEAVALAAAHALTQRGRTACVQAFLDAHPGERADRIAQTLALLAPEG